MNELNPIVTIKAWRRPKMLASVLESITKAYNCDKFKYIISLDNHEATKNDMINVVKDFKNKMTGVEVKVYAQRSNLGCAGSTRFLYSKAFEDPTCQYNFHIEEDIVLGRDCLNYIDWVMNANVGNTDLFAVSPFTRPAQQKSYPDITDDINQSFMHYKYECGGGSAVSRRVYEDIIQKNCGIIGVVGPCNTPIEDPDEWLKSVTHTDKGSWAWVWNKVLVKKMPKSQYSISPMISRTNNIGNTEGVFNPDPNWHAVNVFDTRCIESKQFKDIDVSNVKYETPSLYYGPID